MSRLSREELESMRADGLSSERRAELREAERAGRAWEVAHPMDLGSVLDWIDALRAAFGEPEVDRTPWRGDDFRL